MEIKISLEENVDLAFIKKLLTQIKGIKSFEVLPNETDSEKKYEKLRNLLLEESRKLSAEGKSIPYSPELLNQIFK